MECTCIVLIVLAGIYTINPEREWTPENLYYFIIPFFLLGYYIYVQLNHPGHIRAWILEAYSEKQLEHLAGDHAIKVIAVYFLFLIAMLTKYFHGAIYWEKIKKNPDTYLLIRDMYIFSIVVLIVLAVQWSIYFACRLFQKSEFSETILLFETGDLFFVSLLIQIAPQLAKLNILTRKYDKYFTKKYASSRIQNLDTEGISHRLNQLIFQEKVLRDENITLESLGKYLNLTRSQMSEYINREYQKSFKDFTGFYRVEDAKEILVQNHSLNSSIVAFEVGFNSVSAFYKNFRNLTGLTPDQYRKKFSATNHNPDSEAADCKPD